MGSRPHAVIVVGSHPGRGYSMRRYSALVSSAYLRQGLQVKTMAPSDWLSRRLGQATLRKFVEYVEQLLVFPIRLMTASRSQMWHVTDHSDAILLALLPRRAYRYCIVTCHDLMAVRAALGEIPEHRVKWAGRLYQRFVLRGLSRATQITCVSDATRADVSRLVPGTPSNTIHNPLDPNFELAAREARSAPQPQLALPKKYLTVVSTGGWRKRRQHALAVWHRLHAVDNAQPIELVVVGPPLTEEEMSLVPVAARNLIHVRDQVSDRELATVYGSAVAVLQVSLYEGFGWPIIEANHLGTGAVCTPNDVFLEVAMGAVFVDDSLDLNDWAAIRAHIEGEAFSAAARANARRFKFDDFSIEVTDTLRAVATR